MPYVFFFVMDWVRYLLVWGNFGRAVHTDPLSRYSLLLCPRFRLSSRPFLP